MSDSDDSPKESILKIMDDFLLHLNRTKKLFMVLIFASFAIAPLSIVILVVVLTPSFVTQVGQPYDVAVSFVGSAVHDPELSRGNIWMNESNFTQGTVGGVPMHGVRVAPYGQHDVIIVKSGDFQKLDNTTTMMLKKSAVQLEYVPAEPFEYEVFPMPPPHPRFMYVGEMGSFDRQTDVTFLIIIIVAISAALAITWLALGIKEYKFFSKWNARYSKYRKLQDNLDKELED